MPLPPRPLVTTMQPAAIYDFFRRLAAINPAPVTELLYTNPYTLLVAVVLSAQMTDSGVNKATAPLFKTIATPQQMVKLGEAKLNAAIRGVNFHNTKARNVIKLSQQLIDDFGGQVPNTHQALISLPGVGNKTANVVLNVVHLEPTIAVDTHVFRVANRTGLAKGKTPADVERKLLKVVPLQWRDHAHHWLILHGRYTCKARVPLCPDCVVRGLCAYRDKTVAVEKKKSPSA